MCKYLKNRLFVNYLKVYGSMKAEVGATGLQDDSV